MNSAIERQIQQIYNKIFKQVFAGTNLTSLTKNNRTPIINSLTLLSMSDKYDEFALKFAQELAKKGLTGQKGIWRKYFDAARKTGHIALSKTWTQFEADVMKKAIENNFKMIKSIPQRMMEVLEHKYTSVLIEEVAKGKYTRGTFQRLLAGHGNKQAKLIARTETAKLQTAILESRATQLGSVAYIWLASNDKRTRQSHKNMNGVVVFWRQQSQKPLLDNMRGNAGEFPNCRCSPQPIIDETDLTGSNYKLYDYTSDRVVQMRKNDLIDILKRGSI